MRVLIYEDPKMHSAPRVIPQTLERILSAEGLEVSVQTRVDYVESKLREANWDLIVVHHHDFECVKRLKTIQPEIKVLGVCNAPVPYEEGGFWDDMKKNYDYVNGGGSSLYQRILKILDVKS